MPPSVVRYTYELSEVCVRERGVSRVENVLVWRAAWHVAASVTPEELKQITRARSGGPDDIAFIGGYATEDAALRAVKLDTVAIRRN